MKVRPEVHSTPADLGRSAASTIADGIAAAARAGCRYLLGCPAGRSPEPVYQALAVEVRRRGLDLAHLVLVLMDDYVELDGRGRAHRVPAHLPHSCAGYGRRRIVEPLRRAAAEAAVSTEVTMWSPDPADPAAYDDQIVAAGGIDLFLLASGASDGHVAFNQPGSDRRSITRVVALGELTRRDNLATFPGLTDLDAVPTHGVSVGIATIADLSKSVIMLVHGSDKVSAYRRLVAADGYESDWPATVLSVCRQPRLLADDSAVTADGVTTDGVTASAESCS